MSNTIGFHFLLLAIGEVLKHKDEIKAQDVQKFIISDKAFENFRVTLPDCDLALKLMKDSGFIEEIKNGIYKRTIFRENS